MRFGIELEFYSDRLNPIQLSKALRAQGFNVRRGQPKNLEALPYWKLTEDGSINYDPNADPTEKDSLYFQDYELVSPILDTANPEDIKTVRRIALALQTLGCRVNKTCGLHVHVDASGLTVADIVETMDRYMAFEDDIDMLMTPDRRGNKNSFCRSLQHLKWNRAARSPETLPCDPSTGYPYMYQYDSSIENGRYFKVNLLSLRDHGTIEFRQHQGTINSQTIINWVLFLTQFVDASRVSKKKKKNKAAVCLDTMWTGISDALQSFYVERIQELNP